MCVGVECTAAYWQHCCQETLLSSTLSVCSASNAREHHPQPNNVVFHPVSHLLLISRALLHEHMLMKRNSQVYVAVQGHGSPLIWPPFDVARSITHAFTLFPASSHPPLSLTHHASARPAARHHSKRNHTTELFCRAAVVIPALHTSGSRATILPERAQWHSHDAEEGPSPFGHVHWTSTHPKN